MSTAVTSLGEFLFPVPAERSVAGIVRWWEGRRLAFNAAVGSAGAVSLAAIYVISHLPPGPWPPGLPPWQPVVLFGAMANACYLLGPALEIAALKLWGRSVLPVGPALYRMGLTFSVGLALFPALVVVLVWIARIVATAA